MKYEENQANTMSQKPRKDGFTGQHGSVVEHESMNQEVTV